MKNQYVGDINDYRKYGLIRLIQSVANLNILIAWMLTPDDDSNDGNILEYLQQSLKWSLFDSELYCALNDALSSGSTRGVSLIERSGILGKANYFSVIVPDDLDDRTQWFEDLVLASADADFVFLDPDNGLEIKSKAIGAKYSSKFLYYSEVEALWRKGKSLLIYQHFPRVKRSRYIAQRANDLQMHTKGATVEVFFTPHVAFFLLLQKEHAGLKEQIGNEVLARWPHQFGVWSRENLGIENKKAREVAVKCESEGGFKSGSTKTTAIGYINRNNQKNLGHHNKPGTDHGQVAYKMQCQINQCGHKYGSNGTDIFQRKCPKCQSGLPGIDY